MIRDRVRRTIIVALARLEEAYRIKQAAVDDEVLSAGWDRKIGEVCEAQAWLDNLPQPPQPVYSHRNGETESPTEPGYYWFIDELQPVPVIVSAVDFYSRPDLRVYRIGDSDSEYASHMRGLWYGPIPEPETQHG